MRRQRVAEQDHYAVLEVPPDADGEAIQAAYRARSKQHHPDTGLPGASAEKMQAINEAYRVLSDTQLRQQYDAQHRGERSARVRRTPRGAGDRTLEITPDLVMS